MRFSVFLLTGLLLVGLLSGCTGKTGDEATAQNAGDEVSLLAVSQAVVEQGMLAREVVASGMVAAWEDMSLGVEVSGLRVARVHVEVGQAVKAGEVLLSLDDRAVRSEVAQARAALAEAQAGLTLAEANLERAGQLRARALLSVADFDQLQALRNQAKARLGAARAGLEAAELRLSWATLKAPDDGVISRRMVQPGAVVTPGVELLGLIRQNRLEWRAQVSEAQLPQVAVGQVVHLRAADGSQVQGRVRAVSPGLDAATRTALLHADLPEPGPFRAGMVAEGRIDVGQLQGLSVPLASVVRRDGYAYVFSVDAQGRVARHRVEVGGLVGGRVEILGGVEAGMRVVERGAGFLSDGDRVRVLADTVDGA